MQQSSITTKPQISTSFDPAVFAWLFELENRHFWFRARNRIIAAVMQRLPLAGDARILEIGCGNGNVIRHLSREVQHPIWGADLFEQALRFCRTRVDSPLLQLDVQALPFDASLDAICMFDILEHLPDDVAVLSQVYRALKPGGRLVLTVPAFRRLWSYFDQFSHHQRRYDKGELRHRLEDAGFEVELLTYMMLPLLPLIAVGRAVQSRRGRSVAASAQADVRIIPLVNELLYWLCSVEQWVVPRLGLPFGSSLIAVGYRR